AEIVEMDGSNGIRLSQVEQVVVAADVTRPIGEPFSPIACLVELQCLDHGAHGTIQDEDALSGGAAQRCAHPRARGLGIVGVSRHPMTSGANMGIGKSLPGAGYKDFFI